MHKYFPDFFPRLFGLKLIFVFFCFLKLVVQKFFSDVLIGPKTFFAGSETRSSFRQPFSILTPKSKAEKFELKDLIFINNNNNNLFRFLNSVSLGI